MSVSILSYLLVFNRRTLTSKVFEFGEDAEAALMAYSEREMQHKDDPLTEVVLMGSDSLESVKATHSNYFPEKVVTNGWLADLLTSIDDAVGPSPKARVG